MSKYPLEYPLGDMISQIITNAAFAYPKLASQIVTERMTAAVPEPKPNDLFAVVLRHDPSGLYNASLVTSNWLEPKVIYRAEGCVCYDQALEKLLDRVARDA